ncbi:hypothetical protein LCGC14_1537880 [marine sediment metagenome]|uniref:Uncharacterized protein n=1 Tax=marine sediment metagenome TaxID=412755 RepID=A0A0F9IU02_9ZZZZ
MAQVIFTTCDRCNPNSITGTVHGRPMAYVVGDWQRAEELGYKRHSTHGEICSQCVDELEE